uniref:Protein kinase domain-containing protein n=1 Tax=Syphacia muris TaxID=451379 RepID=A0A0N5B191_9BILA
MINDHILTLVIFGTLQSFCAGCIDLFIDESEVFRLLGISAEMKYITNGTVNDYSSKFKLRVTQNISEVAFSWRSEDSRHQYEYFIDTKSDDGVLPVLHIPCHGIVPSRTKTFVVEYRCSKYGQFEVLLHINIAYPSRRNRTSLILKQQKLCAPIQNSSNSTSLTGDSLFYIIIGCAMAFVLIIIVLLVVYFRPDANSILKYQLEDMDRNGTLQQTLSRNMINSYSAVDADTLNLLSTSKEQYRERYSYPATNHSIVLEKPYILDIPTILNELHVDKRFFEVFSMHVIEGTFGELKWAIWKKKFGGKNSFISNDEKSDYIGEILLVKTLKSNADARQLNIFLEQSLRFHHVPRFMYLGQVEAVAFCDLYDNDEIMNDFPLICYKHQGFGNLKKFLQRCRSGLIEEIQISTGSSATSDVPTLRAHELVSMGIQILKATLHLHTYSVIHKDIAARNCLVSETNQGYDRFFIQLCDTALSKDLFPNDYHCLGDNNNRPVKWMAYESLTNNVYTSATDIWSFGVTLWELLSCGQQPYVDIDPDEMLQLLEQDRRLPQPYNCPDELYSLIRCCWELDYRNRPSCEKLLNSLQSFMVQLRQFI